MGIKFYLKQKVKICLQEYLLPIVYKYYANKKVIDRNLVIFADAHHETLPDSMAEMYTAVLGMGKNVRLHLIDYGKSSVVEVMKSMLRFMKDYAHASTVFICDYYLPAAACQKRPETKVVQLWHACGALKKFGFDAQEDIPSFYKGNPMKNVSLVTVSSPWCIEKYAHAMGVTSDKVKSLGVSRTDRYYNLEYRERCIERFYEKYPEAKGKKIVLWAPTFRGNASNPNVEGLDAVEKLSEAMGDEWYVIKKLHPHLEGKAGYSNCNEKTEDLLAVCDVLITDYSSILFDYMIYQKPLVLYCPDKEEYLSERGFYIDYEEIPGYHIINGDELAETLKRAVYDEKGSKKFFEQYMCSCDGNATERIIKEVFY